MRLTTRRSQHRARPRTQRPQSTPTSHGGLGPARQTIPKGTAWTPPRTPRPPFHVKQRPRFHVKHRPAVSPLTSVPRAADLVSERVPEHALAGDRSTPLAQATEHSLAVAAGRPLRRQLPRPASSRVHRRREPEGWRRQDHHHGQRRCCAGSARTAGAGDRPRPAGQRLDRLGRRARRGDARELPRACRGHRDGRGHRGVSGRAGPLRRPGHDRPRRSRDRAGLPGGSGDAAPQGAGRPPCRVRRGRGLLRLRLHRLPAVARAADRERAQRPATRC